MAIIEEGNTINISLNQDDVGRVLGKMRKQKKEGKNDENTNSQTGQAP